jgi:hypothetical protein
MNIMNEIIVKPKTAQQRAKIKEILDSIEVEYTEMKSPYKKEFVEMVRQVDDEYKRGEYTVVDIDDLWK